MVAPLWKSEDKENPGYSAQAEYKDGNYIVSVTGPRGWATEVIHAGFEPRFGIDVADMFEIQETASKMIESLKRQAADVG